MQTAIYCRRGERENSRRCLKSSAAAVYVLFFAFLLNMI